MNSRLMPLKLLTLVACLAILAGVVVLDLTGTYWAAIPGTLVVQSGLTWVASKLARTQRGILIKVLTPIACLAALTGVLVWDLTGIHWAAALPVVLVVEFGLTFLANVYVERLHPRQLGPRRQHRSAVTRAC